MDKWIAAVANLSVGEVVRGVITSSFGGISAEDEISVNPPAWSMLFSLRYPGGAAGLVMVLAFKALMDLIANGLRIVFALVFLSSFVFRPLIQEPVSRLWYGAIESSKPTFTILFGAVGALVAAGHALAK